LGVRFTILGPVEVLADGRRLPGAAPRHRAALAYLLLHARTVISADRLIDAIWGQTPPDTARAQIHAAVTALRRVLRAAGAAQVLATHAGGYVILPEPGQLDLEEFTSQIAAAQAQAAAGDRRAATYQIRAALQLWQGQPLADVNADYIPDARARLDGRRLAAFERLADLELSLGRHEDLIDEIAAEVAAHPLRERLSGQLMLALHRAGRQADALSAARTFRSALVEQQGLDPSRAFATLEQAILRDDPGLDQRSAPSAEPAAAGQEPANAAGPGDAAPGRQPRRANFLPYDTPDFAGRAVELDQLARSHPGDGEVMTISAIDGMAGIGKTALAIHAGHRLADRFPDGQLFIDQPQRRFLPLAQRPSDGVGQLVAAAGGELVQVLDQVVAGPGSVIISLRRKPGGSAAIAASAKAIWSVAVFEPAEPRRRIQARGSPPVLSHTASSG
jgi:DNA-binding SARP family transcriptional activator